MRRYMRTILLLLLVIVSANVSGATEWRVKSYQGSQVRNTVSEAVAVGARCADVVIWRSSTGKVEYRAIAVTRGGLTVHLPVECEAVTVPDPAPPIGAAHFSWDVETDRTSLGNVLAYYPNTVRDCTVAHSGSCSLRLTIIGADAGNQPRGVDVPQTYYTFNFVGAPALYYRWWMRIDPGFSWGTGTAKTKANRVLGGPLVNGSGHRGYTGYLHATDGFVISGCDIGTTGGCLDNTGRFAGGDHRIKVPYDFRTKADGQWHEYVVKVKSNTRADCTFGATDQNRCDAQLQAWVDGVSVGEYNNYRLHDNAEHTMVEAWGGWMVAPYFQLNGSAVDGGIIYLDDFVTEAR